MGAIRHPSQWCVKLSASDATRRHNRCLAYGPGIVDTPMWDHIDRELAQIVRHLSMFAIVLLTQRHRAGGHQRWCCEGDPR